MIRREDGLPRCLIVAPAMAARLPGFSLPLCGCNFLRAQVSIETRLDNCAAPARATLHPPGRGFRRHKKTASRAVVIYLELGFSYLCWYCPTANKENADLMNLQALTSLRFFAAFAVVLHHLQAFGISVSNHVWGVSFGVAVSFFFVLSGFILSFAYEGKFKTVSDVKRYIWLRLFRIWPLHLVTLAATILLLAGPISLTTLIPNIMMVHSWYPVHWLAFSYNAVSWTISIEWFFYLAFPLLILLRSNRFWIAYSSIVFFNASALFALTLWPDLLSAPPMPGLEATVSTVTTASFPQLFPPMRMIEFASGMALYRLWKGTVRGHLTASTLQLTSILLFITYLPFHMDIVGWLNENTSVAVTVAYRQYGLLPWFVFIILAFSYANGLLAKLISSKALVYLGETSFSLYMVHMIVMRAFIEWEFYAQLGPALSAILATAISIASAIVLFELVECPARNLARRSLTFKRSNPSHNALQASSQNGN